MKKLLALAAVAAGLFVGLRRSRAEQAEADLWAEATDSVPR
ncbi:MAG: DLW-39 family protein [Nocardioidaceae bacterium]